MKILQVVQFFSAKHGGSAMVPYELSKHLHKAGHDVTVLTTDFQMENDFIDYKEGVEVIPFHCQMNIGSLLVSSSMKEYLKQNINKFDVIHMHNFRTYQNIIVHKFAKKYKIPYVLQAHGSVLPFFAKQRLKKLYDLVWGNEILKSASLVIALTKTEAEQYKKMGVDENKIEIVPNGIDLARYENLPKRGEFRKKYAIKNEEKIILYLGRLHKTKGIDLLVKAFAEISKELNNVRLVLVGPDDGYQSALEELIQLLKVDNKVLFTGFVSNEKKMAALVDADVFVTPSFSGFPVTFLEACACGTPIITTSKGDTLDWINDKIGYVVEYDKNHLRDVIIKILSDKKLRRIFGENGRRLVREKFSWDKTVEQLENVYEELIEDQNG